MPVLVKSENMPPPQVTVDLDKLVIDLRERLCLKNKDRNCSRRSSPYQNRRHVNPSDSCCGGSNNNVNSPDQKEYLHKCHRRSKVSKIKCDTTQDPRALLDKLLREQSLIQEAVRRVQFQFQFDQGDVDGLLSNSNTKSDISAGIFVDTYNSCSDNEDYSSQFHYSGSSDVSHHSIK